ncbi:MULTISPECIES: hypothetical protein [Haloferacaceae]|uniref:SipW-cognate class signal peptide n=1 Tax=Halorubrum glutamatedens TaxID=2707018 RepID=A0ABD5QUF0_9EURY|nr:hypothetical protein [Halobellus captivus]
MKRRNLILLLGGASSGAMSVGTGAFSSAEAERGVSVSVEDDKDAFIRYEKPNDGTETEYGEEVTLVRVRNQFGGDQELALVGIEYEYDDETVKDDVLKNITVERYEGPADPDEEFNEEDFIGVNDDHVAIERGSTNGDFPAADDADAFGPGEWIRIVADACVPPGEEVEVAVTITVKGIEGTGITAQLFGDTRRFKLSSKLNDLADLISSVKFPGNSGKVQIRTDSDGGGASERDPEVSATAYYATDGGDVKETDTKDVRVDTQLELDDDFDVSEGNSIVGIAIDGIDGVFVHPKFDDSVCEIVVGNSGSSSAGGGDNPGSGNDNPGNSGGETAETTSLDNAFGNCFVNN